MRTKRGRWPVGGVWGPARAAVAATAAAVAGLGGCQADISPQPEPPVRQDPFEVDFGQVEATVDS
ncbi:MAG: hypothetical protein ACOC1F_09500, partial [Myxococcota bacterium]